MSEHLPQPSQDILTEARTYDSFDAWLSQIPDSRLQQIVGIINRVEAEDIKDEDSLAHLIAVAMRFHDEQAMLIPDVTRAFQVLSTQVVLEAHVRNGILEKQGEYSMSPDYNKMQFAMTEKGREIYGSGGEQ